ncbi:MAG: hypothetical protein GTO40_14570, partial [Deltaproteobacteria bacterium]|nr:hypothetical protein [Deltaproteobacteria bacterium]
MAVQRKNHCWILVFTGVSLLIFCSPQANAAPFYEGKTLTMVQARTPGGSGDVRARVVIRYLQKNLPGKPTIVSRYMSGGGGTVAANYMSKAAKRDGLTIAGIGTSLYAKAFLNARGVRYNLDDFHFLGSSSPGNPQALAVRPALKLDSVEKLKAHKGLRFAQRSVGHSLYIYDRLIAYVLELQDPKWILGYGSTEMALAIEKGEADARTSGLAGFMRDTPQWLEEGFTIPIVVKNSRGQGTEYLAEFPQGVPTLDQFADSKLKKAILRFHVAMRPSGSPYLVPKGVPPTALKTLRKVFNNMWKDPQFARDFQKATAGQPADPMTGAEIEQLIHENAGDEKVKKIYRQLISAGPLPPAR